MALHLPTQEELFLSGGHIAGPKNIRRGPRYNRGNDWRPIMIPVDHKDWDTVKRGWRPRIGKIYFSFVLFK